MSLLSVKNLTVGFHTSRGLVKAVENLSFSLEHGQTLGIVGESGSGKSVTSLAIMGLLPANSEIISGSIEWNGTSLLNLSERKMQKIRGGSISMIFQDPMTSLNPSFTVGFQIGETLKIHHGGTRQEIAQKTIELLGKVGIPEPESRMTSYPHELSGGMSQRVMIAMAIACSPQILIADEPTTALDVTIQSQILDLILELTRQEKTSLMLISHDIGVIAQMTEQTLVLYAGQCVEKGRTSEIIKKPFHPYSEGLLSCLPENQKTKGSRLPTIPGIVPDLTQRPSGCQLNPRCTYVKEKCREEDVALQTQENREVRCWYPL